MATGADILSPEVTNTLVREEWSGMVALAMRITGDLAEAEDAAQEAFVQACKTWPQQGMPDNPAAWLMTVTRNSALNSQKRHARKGHISVDVAPTTQLSESPTVETLGLAEDPEGRLELFVLCCHPSLSRESMVALTLRLVGGLSSEEIARALLSTPTTIQQRIVRAKRKLREVEAGMVLPAPSELVERLKVVLDVIYLVFNEGYASSTDTRMRGDLVKEARRLGELLGRVAPEEPEVWGLAALMAFNDARTPARADGDGALVPLDKQDRSLWVSRAIAEGEVARQRAQLVASHIGRVGAYQLQAEIAAAHCRADSFEQTDWTYIERLYEALWFATGNPVIRLNLVVARSYAQGPEAGLALLDEIKTDPHLQNYPLLHATEADILRRMGQHDRAKEAYARAVEGTTNPAEREHYQAMIELC